MEEDGVKETSFTSLATRASSGLVFLDVGWKSILVIWFVLIVPIFIASFFQADFAKALDFTGVYANCFLFGILPPAMAWINRRRKRYRSAMSSDLLPGGNLVLAILFGIAVILGFWH